MFAEKAFTFDLRLLLFRCLSEMHIRFNEFLFSISIPYYMPYIYLFWDFTNHSVISDWEWLMSYNIAISHIIYFSKFSFMHRRRHKPFNMLFHGIWNWCILHLIYSGQVSTYQKQVKMRNVSIIFQFSYTYKSTHLHSSTPWHSWKHLFKLLTKYS